jgi:predicted anti-sigma-YlaC factor YlaD
MQHLSEEQLVAHYYRDFDAPAGAAEHLMACPDCRTQYDTLCRVLTLVDELPVPERGDEYADKVWNRLRWRLERRKRRTWTSVAALAAVLAIAFFAGQLWHARSGAATQSAPAIMAHNDAVSTTVAPVKQTTLAAPPDAQANQRVLVVVVSDHLDST